MSRRCAVTKKGVQYGNNVSHANNKTRRRWQPNLQACSFPSEILGERIRLRLSVNGMRTIEHRGGIDAFLLSAKNSELGPQLRLYKKRLEAAQAANKTGGNVQPAGEKETA